MLVARKISEIKCLFPSDSTPKSPSRHVKPFDVVNCFSLKVHIEGPHSPFFSQFQQSCAQ